MRTPRVDRLKDALKTLLKKQDKSYADLAAHLDVSLPTVKRILGPEELSLNRLLLICDWLGVSLAELEALAGFQARQSAGRFTPEQEKFFVEQPSYLSYLTRLHSGDSPEKIAIDHGLTAKSTELYLLRLERLELLRRDTKGRVQLRHAEFPGVLPDGQLIRARYRDIIRSGAEFFQRQVAQALGGVADKEKRKTFVGVSVLRGERQTFLDWITSYEKSKQELASQADSEERLGIMKDPQTMVLCHMHTLLPDKDTGGDELTQSIFGRIVNLEGRNSLSES